MSKEKGELVVSSIRLIQVGEALDSAKTALMLLIKQGMDYDTNEVKNATAEYLALQAQWDELEKEHLELRKRLPNA